MPDDPMPGESAVDYLLRMHLTRPVEYAKASRTCNCPRAYSRCRWAVRYDDLRGDHSAGHGGWGWHK